MIYTFTNYVKYITLQYIHHWYKSNINETKYSFQKRMKKLSDFLYSIFSFLLPLQFFYF